MVHYGWISKLNGDRDEIFRAGRVMDETLACLTCLVVEFMDMESSDGLHAWESFGLFEMDEGFSSIKNNKYFKHLQII